MWKWKFPLLEGNSLLQAFHVSKTIGKIFQIQLKLVYKV